MDQKAHWEQIYTTKGPDQVSWFEAEATLSLALIAGVVPDRDDPILDVGAGAATLVDGLIDAGYRNITVLDLSAAALVQAKQRLGEQAGAVTWREGDILTADLPATAFGMWHDRAVFHFLTDAADRVRYVEQARHALRPGGYALVATFAEDGPTRCSGLAVARYAPDALHAEFGADFRLVESHRQLHHTPWGSPQSFVYCLCRYEPRRSVPHAPQPPR